jgi:hypothetical protein
VFVSSQSADYTCVTLQVGDKYEDHYVHALRRSLREYGHDLVVLGSEYPLPDVPLEGWWWKTVLFSKTLQDDLGPMLWLDLDTVLMNPIDWIKVDRFMCLRSAWMPDEWGSGVMTIPPGTGHKLWDQVRRYPGLAMKYQGQGLRFGDQGLVRAAYEHGWIKAKSVKDAQLQYRWPGKLASYKKEVIERNTDPYSRSIIFFHGRPRPHEVFEPWMEKWHAKDFHRDGSQAATGG